MGDVVFATCAHSPVKFHVFTVVRREHTASISDDHRHCTHHWGRCKRERLTIWDGRKEKTATITTLQRWHRRCGVCYTLTCHVPCVHRVRRRENTAGNSDDHRHCIHHWGKCKREELTVWDGKREKTATITTLQRLNRRCGVCYTLTCHVPCVHSSEEERKHDRQ